jgi:hypothetical protein
VVASDLQSDDARGQRKADTGRAPFSLASIDPLAALAQTQEQLRDRLLELTPVSDADLRAAWEASANPQLAALLADAALAAAGRSASEADAVGGAALAARAAVHCSSVPLSARKPHSEAMSGCPGRIGKGYGHRRDWLSADQGCEVHTFRWPHVRLQHLRHLRQRRRVLLGCVRCDAVGRYHQAEVAHVGVVGGEQHAAVYVAGASSARFRDAVSA